MIFVSLHGVQFNLGRQIAAGIFFLEGGQGRILGIAQIAPGVCVKNAFCKRFLIRITGPDALAFFADDDCRSGILAHGKLAVRGDHGDRDDSQYFLDCVGSDENPVQLEASRHLRHTSKKHRNTSLIKRQASPRRDPNGDVPCVNNPAETKGFYANGDVVPLIAFSDERLPNFPDVRTVKELGKDFSYYNQRAIVGAPGMSDEAAAYYQDLFTQIYESEEWQGYLKSESLEPLQKAPDEQRAYWKTQVENHTALLKALGE